MVYGLSVLFGRDKIVRKRRFLFESVENQVEIKTINIDKCRVASEIYLHRTPPRVD